MYYLNTKKITLLEKNLSKFMTNYRSKIVILFIGLAISSCLVVQNQFLGLAPGPWRAVLKLEFVPVTPNPKGKPLPEKLNLEFEEVSKGEGAQTAMVSSPSLVRPRFFVLDERPGTLLWLFAGKMSATSRALPTSPTVLQVFCGACCAVQLF